MSITLDELDKIGDAFVRSIETGDASVFEQLRGDTMVTWHNHDRVEVVQDPADDGPARLHSVLSDVEVEVVTLQRCDRGVVIEWILRAVVKHSGAPFELHNCLVFTVEGGKIVRANEYVDPNFFNHFPAAPAAVTSPDE